MATPGTAREPLELSLHPTVAEKAAAAALALGVEYVDLGAPLLADVDKIVTSLDPIADGALTIAAQPTTPCNLTATLTDANDSVTAGTLTLNGLDMAGKVIQEVHAFGTVAAKTFTGTKIFASVTSGVVADEAGAASGDALTVGVGNLIGLPKPILNTSAVKLVSVNAIPVTADAIQVSTAALETHLSAVDANGATYDGSKIMRVAYRPGE